MVPFSKSVSSYSQILAELHGGDTVLIVGDGKIECAKAILSAVPMDVDIAIHIHMRSNEKPDAFDLLKSEIKLPHQLKELHADSLREASRMNTRTGHFAQYDIIVIMDRNAERPDDAIYAARLLRPGGSILVFKHNQN